MGIDASIYSNVQAPPQSFNPVNSVESAYKLSQMAMQQQMMGYQMQQQGAVRGALSKNTDTQTGQLDRTGFLSDLGRAAPQAAMEYQNHFAQQDKQQAEAQIAQMQSAHQKVSLTVPALGYLLKMPDSEAAAAFPGVMAQLKEQGVSTQNIPTSWDRGWAQQGYQIGSKTKEGLENQMIASNIGKVPLERQQMEFGSRGANAELTSQYDKQAQPIRNSQVNMNQLLEAYHGKAGPQADMSMLMNVYKIKFPDKPDMPAMEELKHSQSAGDLFRQAATKILSGGLDQATKDNLMRDGMATFNANVKTLRGTQQRIQSRQQFQGVNDPSLTNEPGINKTSDETLALEDKLGPYIPGNQRGGISGTLSNVASKVLGLGGGQSANASQRSAPSPAPNGMIRMGGFRGDPPGATRLIPVGMKGEAISAGGSVAK